MFFRTASVSLAQPQEHEDSRQGPVTRASGISVIGAPDETLVGETLVSGGNLRRNFRNFRKRYANQDGGRNVAHRRKPARGFRSFRKRYANCGGVDVPAQP